MSADLARRIFLQACRLDIEVRKPGNVSIAAPGHGMVAGQFLASADAACDSLFEAGAPVGRRIEGAVAASFAAAGCNTNLGIVLLTAPIAAAAERPGALAGREALRTAIGSVLEALDVDDARAAFRAIVRANPGGLGTTREHDVHGEARIDLRTAMRFAAGRDRIARQYHEGYADLFGLPLPDDWPPAHEVVQRLYLGILARWPDSHIVRRHGEALAQNVMDAAQGWLGRGGYDSDPAFAEWDAELKARGVNPGTSADLTVAALLLAGLTGHRRPPWHGT